MKAASKRENLSAAFLAVLRKRFKGQVDIKISVID
jgi:hypothetical protein